jgi:predicted MFS family arabinose efflux permease
LAKELGGTNAALGLVTLAFGVVSLVMTPIGGVLADRVPKRQILILATAFLAVSNGALGMAEVFNVTRFWMLIVVSAAICFLFLDPGLPNPDRPQQAPLVEMADGFRYATSVPSLRIVVSLAILVTMVGFPYIAFLPSVAEDFFGRGSEGFALLSLVGAGGGLVAGVGMARTVLSQGPRVQLVSGLMLAVGWHGCHHLRPGCWRRVVVAY